MTYWTTRLSMFSKLISHIITASVIRLSMFNKLIEMSVRALWVSPMYCVIQKKVIFHYFLKKLKVHMQFFWKIIIIFCHTFYLWKLLQQLHPYTYKFIIVRFVYDNSSKIYRFTFSTAFCKELVYIRATCSINLFTNSIQNSSFKLSLY
jgi:hypothetical protein